MNCIPFENGLCQTWNELVRTSKNGTFLFEREYMDYHAERFTDASLLFFSGSKCVGLLPANFVAGEQTICSHGGLTYGGLVLPKHASAADVGEMLSLAFEHYAALGAKRFVCKPVPAIYHSYPADEQLYWLFRHGARLTARGLSSAVDLAAPLPLSTLRKRKIKHAQSAGIQLIETASLEEFWNILSDVLQERHGVHPVHTLAEISLLQSRFPQNIRLFGAGKDGRLLGGTLVFETERVAHAQYIAANAEGRENGALDLLFGALLERYAKHATIKYFDFGISTEDDGKILNDGLLFQKEGFGGRGITYDVYECEIS